MSDPSFILQGTDATRLRDMARELQALLDTRDAAMQQPVSTFGDLEELEFTLPESASAQQR
jgi:hypothetical protein